ncbi:hypothetical protein DYB37_004335 [Aphanomyces astaci]|uniref:PH domain-containing protein n=1 Tax=Aphanomyces astaci TaxID=112090 RepID=A0A418D0P0_APHAT|nr:hypothetical protein DYB35_003144 [Aphanomyces astaci]RHZ15288.1 hypothetical protein DYB37_004335 [Aphanomyces astaci]
MHALCVMGKDCLDEDAHIGAGTMALGFGSSSSKLGDSTAVATTAPPESRTGKFFRGMLGNSKSSKKISTQLSSTSSVAKSTSSVSDDEGDLERSGYSAEHKQHNNGKKTSLISSFQENHDGHHESDFYAPTSKSGVLVKQANHLKNWKKRFMVLRGQSMFYYVSGTSSEETFPRGVISLSVRPIKSASLPVRDGVADVRESKEQLYQLPALEGMYAQLFKPKYKTEKYELRDRQIKLMQDIHTYCDTYPYVLIPTLMADPSLFKELLHMTSSFLFRPFPRVPAQDPNAVFFEETSPDTDAAPFSIQDLMSDMLSAEDQEWSVLSTCYDILVRAIEYIDQLDKQVRKDFFTPRFTVLHRLYYKLTQRRALIRKEIANVFYEYVYESSNYYGVTELLEILGSIINGFACPIKEEHVVLLVKSLVPLHSTQAYTSYHQQLMYCMIQFVSKDHVLYTPIARGVLKYWPVGNAFKEIVFLIVLEELFEYVLAESDLAPVARTMGLRLGKCMSSIQQQVADRALACWNSPACVRVMNTYEKVGQDMFDLIRPNLVATMLSHWNVLTQQKARTAYKTYYNMGYEKAGNALDNVNDDNESELNSDESRFHKSQSPKHEATLCGSDNNEDGQEDKEQQHAHVHDEEGGGGGGMGGVA